MTHKNTVIEEDKDLQYEKIILRTEKERQKLSFCLTNDRQLNKIIFTHFNHTNPLIDESSKEHEEVLSKGFRIAKEGDNFYL